MRWELNIDEIQTYVSVGIAPHEQQAPQRILVSARIWADYPAKPTSIDECVDYGLLHELVVHQWPTREHTELLETLAMELFEYLFKHSLAIQEVEVGIHKPDIFEEIHRLGVSARLTREEFKQL